MDTAYRFSSKHLKAIRFRHKSTFHPTVPTCQECQQSWSCDTDDVLARIVGLERQLAEAQGKLVSVQDWINGLNAPDDWAAGLVGDVKADLERILSKEKE